jgi:hypothetical protein
MRKISGVAAIAAAIALLSVPARAQDPYDRTMQGPSRVAVEGFLAQYWVDNPIGDRQGVGGVGVRAMFGRGAVTGAINTFFSRARAGVFVVYTAEQEENDISTFHFGGQAEAPLFAAPIVGGYLDPFVSLSAGAFRTSQDLVGPGDRATTNFALTPGVGTLIPLFGAIAIRGDIRDVIVFGEGDTANNFVVEGGISIGF